MTNEEAIRKLENIYETALEYRDSSSKLAFKLAIEALENMENHLCFTCANNAYGKCETQNVIKCGNYERKEL